jgi:hypothetical protein
VQRACLPAPLTSWLRLKESRARERPQLVQTCNASAPLSEMSTAGAELPAADVAVIRSACRAAACLRSSAATASTHCLHLTGVSGSRALFSSCFLLNSAATNRLRPHGPQQTKDPAHAASVPCYARATCDVDLGGRLRVNTRFCSALISAILIFSQGPGPRNKGL